MAKSRPFLKYIGSKQHELKLLKYYFPKGHISTLIEPFVGGGAVTFYYLRHHKANNAIISDLNIDLINCYWSIKYNHKKLIRYLKQLSRLKATRKEYYIIRHFFNVWHRCLSYNSSALLASLYVWMNNIDFNGLIRYDKSGNFNVAFNKNHEKFNYQRKKAIINADHKALQKVKIYYCDFAKTMNMATSGSYVFLDPPYLKPKMFKRYGSHRYQSNDADRLKQECFKLNNKHIKWLETNTDSNQIRYLYSGMKQHHIYVPHLVSWKDYSRGNYKELIITNYQNHPIVNHPTLATGKRFFQLRYLCLDLLHLAKLRRSHAQSFRWYQDLLFFYATSYVHLSIVNDVQGKIKYVNDQFAKPLNKAIINELATEFGLSLWHFSKIEIIQDLEITYNEQLRMHYLILNRFKNDKLNLKRRIKSQNSPAKRKRRKRNRKILNLHNKKHLTNKLIAQKLNISRNTVSNVINKK